MAKPYDTRLIMMVSQMPFEAADMRNKFCKLLPMVYVDGGDVTEAAFPNDGEIWWMLTARTASLAVAGKLLVGTVEDAVRHVESDPNSSYYQVSRDSVRELDQNDGLEVLTIPNNSVDSMEDLISTGFWLPLPSHPTAQVMIRWRGNVYGPFKTTRDAGGPAGFNLTFAFSPASADMTVYQLAEAAFDEATRSNRQKLEGQVSPTMHRRTDGHHLQTVRHELLLSAGFDAMFSAEPRKLMLEPVDRKLMRYARDCLTRKKRQDLRTLLADIELSGREREGEKELVETLSRVRHSLHTQDATLQSVAKALLESGLLGEDRIRKAELAFAERYVQEQAAQLQAKAQESLKSVSEELRQAQANLKDVQARLQREESEKRSRLDRELQRERVKADQEIATNRSALDAQRVELERQQTVLQRNLEQVTERLRTEGDAVVNQFLTIAPLLGLTGLMSGSRLAERVDTEFNQVPAALDRQFELPAFIRGNLSADVTPLTEADFFDRFLRFVEESGFVYRPLDLQRFHLSVKVGEMTVLGGPSGTGKSSLPVLYSQALLGDESVNGRPECLMVNVNPSWMDIRDLLGHMNTLEGRYFPAETGLFQHLIYAQEEYGCRQEATGIYLTCLDEMNLSQIEHYFSDFMMVLDRGPGARVIQCFSPDSAHPTCQFRPYARLQVSPGMRFIGTVNFDETTRLLSDRFLDRVNLIRLVSGSLPNISKSDGDEQARTRGRMVTFSDFQSWRVDAALPAELGSLLDSMRPLLGRIGCPLSPRVYRGICRFVASAVSIMQPPTAFDVQIAQRIIPKIRGLVTSSQLEALDELLRLMNSANTCGFDESLPLLEEVRESASARTWDLEE